MRSSSTSLPKSAAKICCVAALLAGWAIRAKTTSLNTSLCLPFTMELNPNWLNKVPKISWKPSTTRLFSLIDSMATKETGCSVFGRSSGRSRSSIAVTDCFSASPSRSNRVGPICSFFSFLSNTSANFLSSSKWESLSAMPTCLMTFCFTLSPTRWEVQIWTRLREELATGLVRINMMSMLSDFWKTFQQIYFGHYILSFELFISALVSFLGQKCGSQD